MAIIYDATPDKKLNKAVFGETIESIANEDSSVVYLDADLMNSSGTLGFWRRNPGQAINCGIAEANMMGVAAGLAAGGKRPYVHTFGPFASRRCYDQVFISIAYAKNSVRIFGSDPGVTAAFNGGTHMPFEDMALMRAIPHSTVIDISDSTMLASIMRQVRNREGLIYARFTRKSYSQIYSEDHTFSIGKGEVVREGSDASVIACGLMVSEALAAADILSAEGINIKVIDMFSVKPLDADLVLQTAKNTGAIITAENHNVIGGLGDAVAEVLLEAGVAVKFRKHGVRESFGSVGPQSYLQEFYGLTAARLCETIKTTMQN